MYFILDYENNCLLKDSNNYLTVKDSAEAQYHAKVRGVNNYILLLPKETHDQLKQYVQDLKLNTDE